MYQGNLLAITWNTVLALANHTQLLALRMVELTTNRIRHVDRGFCCLQN